MAETQNTESSATAQQQAADIVAEARRQAESIQAAGQNAIALAMRDTLLSLEGEIVNEFRNKLCHLVKGLLLDTEFLQRLILEVAGHAAPVLAAGRVQLLLPAEVVSLEDLCREPEEAVPGTLMHFVLSLGGGLLREGLSFGVAADGAAGIQVSLVEDDVRIDLTESAVGELLLQHLLPRFRALLRGQVVLDRHPGGTDRAEVLSLPPGLT